MSASPIREKVMRKKSGFSSDSSEKDSEKLDIIEETKDDFHLQIGPLPKSNETSDHCQSCSELNYCEIDCENKKECEDAIRKGVFTKWWTKVPPVDGHSHFENLQSTNWNSLRFKPPPTADSAIGWRVEFRPMDI